MPVARFRGDAGATNAAAGRRPSQGVEVSTPTRDALARDAAHKSVFIQIVVVATITAALLFVAAAGADPASAAYNVTGFQFATGDQQAGGHSPVTQRVTADAYTADRTGGDDLKKLVVDYPVGLAINPEAATPKCVASGTGSTNKFTSDACPATSYVGSVTMSWRDSLGNLGSTVGSVNVLTPTTSGSSATLGLTLRPSGWKKIFLKAEVRQLVPVRPAADAQYGMSLTADSLPRSLSPSFGLSRSITLSELSIGFNSRAGGSSTTAGTGGFFVFHPTRCDAASYRGVTTTYSGANTTRTGSLVFSGCSDVPLAPGASVKPTVSTPSASTGVDAQVSVPTADATIQQTHVREVAVDLPTGTTLNPTVLSSSTSVCSNTSLSADSCPSASRVGTASALVPFAPPAFSGDVFLQSRTGTIGLGIVLRGPNSTKLVLKGTLALAGDHVRIVVPGLPQVPWTTATLKLTSLLVKNPAIGCQPSTASTTFNGWSGASATITNEWSSQFTPCAPDTTITAGPTGTIGQSSATFDFVSSIAGSTFDCSIDGSPSVPCSPPQMFSGFADGPHQVCVRAINGSTPDPTPDCRSFTVDTTSPSVSVSCGSGATATSRNCVWTVDDPSATVTCSVDGAAIATCPNPIVVAGVGAHTIVITATDPVGNSGSAAASLFIDDPITVQITAPANNSSTSAASVPVSFVVNGSTSIPAGTQCVLNGSPVTTTIAIPVALAMGANTISVVCTNAVSSASSTIVVNRGAPPVVAITSPINGSVTTASTINVSFVVNGSSTIPAGTTCTVNGTSTTSATTNPVNVPLGGTFTISVVCTNMFGAGTATVVVITGDPFVIIEQPVDPTFTSAGSINIRYTVAGSTTIPAGTTCTVSNQATGVSLNSTSGVTNTVLLANGANLITVACASAFGVLSDSVTVHRGNPPVVSITAPANNSNTTASTVNVAFVVTATPPFGGGTSCTVNGTTTTSTTTNPVSLAFGANVIVVTCTNVFGSSTATVIVNRGSESLVITSPPNGMTTSGSTINVTYLLNGSATIPAGTTCTVNGAPSSGGTTNPVPLLLGANPINVTCTTPISILTASVTVTRGNPPVVAIVSPNPSNPPSGPTVNVQYTVNGATTIPAGTTCTVNGQASNDPMNNPIPYNPPMTITVSCTNAFGVNSVSIFLPGPSLQVAITAPANNSWTSAATTNVRFTVSGGTTIPAGTSCTVNGVATTSTQTNSVPLALGANTISVQCVNSFGPSNLAQVTVNRDNTPPTISNVWITPRTTPGPATITYSVGDNSGQPVTCNPPSGSTIQLVSGTNTITIVCIDAAGNAASYTAMIVIQPPSSFTVTITSGPPSVTTNPSPSFEYVSSIPVWYSPPCPPGQVCIQIVERVVAFDCTMDGSSVGCGDSSYTSPPLDPGPHTFCVTGRYLPTGQLSNTDCYSFTVGGETWPPSVAITSPTNGSTTAAASTNVAFTVNGGASIPAGTTCTVNGSPTSSATSNSVGLVVGANTITVVCTDANGTGSAVATVTRTSDAGFEPTFAHSLSPTTIGAAHRLNFGFTTPEGAEQVRRVQINEDIKVQPNFPGFGLPEDMCETITTIPFDASTCPDSSFIGTLQLVITGVTHITYGKIYLVDRSPLPRLAVDMKVSYTGGPASMDFQTFIELDLPKVDPNCDPMTHPDGYCQLRVRMTMDNLPNIGITGGYVALGRSGRVGVSGPIATEIFRTSPGGAACDPTITTVAQFTGWSGSMTAATDSDTHTCP